MNLDKLDLQTERYIINRFISNLKCAPYLVDCKQILADDIY